MRPRGIFHKLRCQDLFASEMLDANEAGAAQIINENMVFVEAPRSALEMVTGQLEMLAKAFSIAHAFPFRRVIHDSRADSCQNAVFRHPHSCSQETFIGGQMNVENESSHHREAASRSANDRIFAGNLTPWQRWLTAATTTGD